MDTTFWILLALVAAPIVYLLGYATGRADVRQKCESKNLMDCV